MMTSNVKCAPFLESLTLKCLQATSASTETTIAMDALDGTSANTATTTALNATNTIPMDALNVFKSLTLLLLIHTTSTIDIDAFKFLCATSVNTTTIAALDALDDFKSIRATSATTITTIAMDVIDDFKFLHATSANTTATITIDALGDVKCIPSTSAMTTTTTITSNVLGVEL